MTDILANLIGEKFRNVPKKCDLRVLEIRTLSGVPHCGSPIESDYLPPSAVVCVNSDSVLCEENTIICGAVKPPCVTAIFKMTGISACISKNTNLEIDVESKRTIFNCVNALVQSPKPEHATCSPEFFESINKHPWIDDDELIKTLKANLSVAQGSVAN